jgi:hypothetical protein
LWCIEHFSVLQTCLVAYELLMTAEVPFLLMAPNTAQQRSSGIRQSESTKPHIQTSYRKNYLQVKAAWGRRPSSTT